MADTEERGVTHMGRTYNTSTKSKLRSIRIPNELWADIEHAAAKEHVTFNEWVVGCARKLTPERPPEVAEGQRSLFPV